MLSASMQSELVPQPPPLQPLCTISVQPYENMSHTTYLPLGAPSSPQPLLLTPASRLLPDVSSTRQSSSFFQSIGATASFLATEVIEAGGRRGFSQDVKRGSGRAGCYYGGCCC